MPCPTCDGTMQMIFNATNHKAWWCDRCGTLKDDRLGHVVIIFPKLVERCRQFQAMLIEAEQPDGIEAIRIIGIIESINTPENRP